MTGDSEHRVVASVTVNGHAPARGPGGAGAAECVIPSPPAGATAAWLCAEVERRCLFAVPAEVVATERIRCAAEGGEEVADAEVVSGRGPLAVSFRRTPRAGRLPREMVMRMYARENELRLSPEVQAEYSEQLIPFNGPTTRNLQRQLLREFGLPSCDDGLRVWWTQRGIYQRAGDAEVLAIPLYVKHDHSRQGDLSVGDDYVDCRLVGLDGAERKLSDFVTAAEGRPLVVIGASYS